MMFLGLLINLFTSIVLPILEGLVAIVCQIAFWLFTVLIKETYKLFMALVDIICNALNRVKAPVPPTVTNKETVQPIVETDVAIPVSPSLGTPSIIDRQDPSNFKEPPEHIN